MAMAAVVVGAHGVMIETHPDPEHALSDGPQLLNLRDFEKMHRNIIVLERFIKGLQTGKSV